MPCFKMMFGIIRKVRKHAPLKRFHYWKYIIIFEESVNTFLHKQIKISQMYAGIHNNANVEVQKPFLYNMQG